MSHRERSLPERARRAVLCQGAEQLADHDLLALVLSPCPNARGVAAGLLDDAGGLDGLARSSVHGLKRVAGIGVSRAVRVAAAFELGRRAIRARRETEHAVFGSFDAVVDWAMPRLSLLEQEEVWILALDARNRLKLEKRVAQGGLHGCALSARDVLGPVLRAEASALVLIHNHPSGDPNPSPEDVEMTRALSAACRAIGICLLDHVIVGRSAATSLLELGLFEEQVALSSVRQNRALSAHGPRPAVRSCPPKKEHRQIEPRTREHAEIAAPEIGQPET